MPTYDPLDGPAMADRNLNIPPVQNKSGMNDTNVSVADLITNNMTRLHKCVPDSNIAKRLSSLSFIVGIFITITHSLFHVGCMQTSILRDRLAVP